MTNVEHLELTELRPGDRIDAKYEVQYVLGRGGMGVVVAAVHLDLQELVALKFLLPGALLQPDTVDRFLREARSVRKLHSEHVVKVLDVGRLSSTGLPYMAMELLHGEDLATSLTEQGPLSIAMACDILIQACDAIGEAHAQGIIHRDIKPANLFVLRELVNGRRAIKVLDFGIAKVLDPEHAGGTRAQTIMGSAYYMSPEQLRSTTNVDGRTDIWALGITLYELLTAQHPFGGASIPQLVYSVTASKPIPPRTYRPELPARLEEIILRCLEKSPEARFGTAGELATALAEFAGQDDDSFAERVLPLALSEPSGPPTAPEALATTSTENPLAAPVAPQRRMSLRHARFGVLALFAVAVTLTGALWPESAKTEGNPIGIQVSANTESSTDASFAIGEAPSATGDSNRDTIAVASTTLGNVDTTRVVEAPSAPPSSNGLPPANPRRKNDPTTPSRRLPGQLTHATPVRSPRAGSTSH